MLDQKQERPGYATEAPSMSLDGDIISLPDIVDHLDHTQRRVVQEALANGHRATLLRRAEAFEWAKPDPDHDYIGRATPEELREAWRRCDARARACRAAAEVAVIA